VWKATQCGVTRGGGLSQAHRVRWAVTRSHVPLPSAPCLCAVCGPHRILVCWQTVWKATQCGVTRGGGLSQAHRVRWAVTRSHVPLPSAPCLCAVCGPHRILVCWQTVWKATHCGVTRGGGLSQAHRVRWAVTRSHVPLPSAPCLCAVCGPHRILVCWQTVWKATHCGVTRGGGLSQAHRVRWAVTRSHVPLPSAPCLCAVCGPHRILVCWQTVWKATQCGVTRGGGLRQARGVGWAATRSHVPLPSAPCLCAVCGPTDSSPAPLACFSLSSAQSARACTPHGASSGTCQPNQYLLH
jgi:ribosomal protein S9